MTAASLARPLRVAVVGCGGVARTQHLPAYRKLAARGVVEVAALCDVDETRARAVAAELGGTPYTSVERMLSAEHPDVVDVCTPEDKHTAPVLAALEAGAHVLCEKIMAESLESGRAMVRTARERDRFLGVDYNYRFMPAFARARQLIDSGELGEMAVIGVSSHAYCFHHAIDLVRFLAREACGEIVSVGAQYTATADPAHHFRVQLDEFVYVPSHCEAVIFRFASGAVATIASRATPPTRLAPQRAPRFRSRSTKARSRTSSWRSIAPSPPSSRRSPAVASRP